MWSVVNWTPPETQYTSARIVLPPTPYDVCDCSFEGQVLGGARSGEHCSQCCLASPFIAHSSSLSKTLNRNTLAH